MQGGSINLPTFGAVVADDAASNPLGSFPEKKKAPSLKKQTGGGGGISEGSFRSFKESIITDGGNGGSPPSAETYIRKCKTKIDLDRSKRHISETEELVSQQRKWEREKMKYNSDVTLPVTDDVAIIIGKLRELAFVNRVQGLSPLLTQLENAIEVQMVSFFEAMRENGPSVVESIKPYLQSTLVKANSMNENDNDRGPGLGSPTRRKSSSAAGGSRGGSRVGSASPKGPLSPLSPTRRTSSRPSSSGPLKPPVPRAPPLPRSGERTDSAGVRGGAVSSDKSILFAPMMALVAESLARNTKCEMTNVFLLGSDERNLTCVGRFPPPAENEDEDPPKLSRALVSAVLEKGLGVSGQEQKQGHGLVELYRDLENNNNNNSLIGNSQGGDTGLNLSSAAQGYSTGGGNGTKLQASTMTELGGGGESSKKKASSSSECRNTLAWPIKGVVKGKIMVVGVLEMINKVQVSEDQDASKFHEEDEIFAHCTAKLVGALMKPYGYKIFSAKNYSSAILNYSQTHGPGCLGSVEVIQATKLEQQKKAVGMKRGSNSSSNAATGDSVLGEHLPIHISKHLDLPLKSADLVSRHIEAAAIPTYIYRGPMKLLHKAGNDKNIGRGGGEGFTGAGMTGSLDLRSIEGTLDSLNDMWHHSYEENVSMHQQCRRWATKVRDLNNVVSALQDALIEAREIDSLEEVKSYLKLLELSFKSGNPASSADFLNKATSQRAHQHAGKSSSSSTALVGQSSVDSHHKRSAVGGSGGGTMSTAEPSTKSIQDLYVEGAEGVRTYTVDPETKLIQQEAIGKHMAKFEERKKQEEKAILDAIPHSTHGTLSSLIHATKPPQAYVAISRTSLYKNNRHGGHLLDKMLPAPSPFRMGSAGSSSSATRPLALTSGKLSGGGAQQYHPPTTSTPRQPSSARVPSQRKRYDE